MWKWCNGNGDYPSSGRNCHSAGSTGPKVDQRMGDNLCSGWGEMMVWLSSLGMRPRKRMKCCRWEDYLDRGTIDWGGLDMGIRKGRTRKSKNHRRTLVGKQNKSGFVLVSISFVWNGHSNPPDKIMIYIHRQKLVPISAGGNRCSHAPGEIAIHIHWWKWPSMVVHICQWKWSLTCSNW